MRRLRELRRSGMLEAVPTYSTPQGNSAAGMLPSIAAYHRGISKPIDTHVDKRAVDYTRSTGRILNKNATGDMLGLSLGGHVSMGRNKWQASSSTVEGASIFSVKAGAQLAEEGDLLVQRAEAAAMPGGIKGAGSRALKVHVPAPSRMVEPKAKDLLHLTDNYKMRLLPEFTPGRAMAWGGVLAIWGSFGLAARCAQSFGIHSLEDVSPKLSAALVPVAQNIADNLIPFRKAIDVRLAGAGESEVAASLKAKMRN